LRVIRRSLKKFDQKYIKKIVKFGGKEMIIKTRGQIPVGETIERNGIKKELVIGEYDDSNQIVLRILSLEANCFIPAHAHDFPHIWKIEKGIGILTDNDGSEHKVTAGQFIFIKNNEKHGMRNIGDENLEYLCFGTIDSEKSAPKRGSLRCLFKDVDSRC
jgi:quercetin dioxygenase-like cupin family protein